MARWVTVQKGILGSQAGRVVMIMTRGESERSVTLSIGQGEIPLQWEYARDNQGSFAFFVTPVCE